MTMGFTNKDLVTAYRIVATDGSGHFSTLAEAVADLPVTGGAIYLKEGIHNIHTTIDLFDGITITGA